MERFAVDFLSLQVCGVVEDARFGLMCDSHTNHDTLSRRSSLSRSKGAVALSPLHVHHSKNVRIRVRRNRVAFHPSPSRLKGEQKRSLTRVGFEPTPFRTAMSDSE